MTETLWDPILQVGYTIGIPSLKLTFSHLKMDGWKTTFLLEWPIFRGELLVSGRVLTMYHGNLSNLQSLNFGSWSPPNPSNKPFFLLGPLSFTPTKWAPNWNGFFCLGIIGNIPRRGFLYIHIS